MLAANATLVPGYARGLSEWPVQCPPAPQLIACECPGIPCSKRQPLEILLATCWTPTNHTCAARKFRNGSDHVREKDGLWAVLFC